jgi:hypothetical protein
MKKQTSVNDFMNRKKVGLILRVFATKPEDVENRVAMISKAIEATKKAVVQGRPLIQRIDVLVWSDQNYKDSDCGQTAAELKKRFRNEKNLYVSEVRNSDIFCGILNYGVAHQIRHGVDYSIIVSAEAFSYMTPETMEKMVEAACHGARAVGVAINELSDSILDGRIANTFAMWHNESLLTIGGFDLKAAKPTDDRSAHYMQGWNVVEGNVYYQLAGVEEIISLARLVKTFGPCIAPILPEGQGAQRYQSPDKITQPQLWLRHISKMGTKIERQSSLAASIDCDLSYIRGGVIPEYRQN